MGIILFYLDSRFFEKRKANFLYLNCFANVRLVGFGVGGGYRTMHFRRVKGIGACQHAWSDGSAVRLASPARVLAFG